MSKWFKYNFETKQVELKTKMPLFVKMKPKMFIPEFNLGQIVQVLSLGITLVALWFKTDNRISRLEIMMETHSKVIESITVNQTALIKSLAILEERTTRNAK